MKKHRKLMPLLQLGIAILAIIILSAGLSALEFQSGKPSNILGMLTRKMGPLRTTSPSVSDGDGGGPLVDVLVGILWLSFAFSVVFAIISPAYRKQLIQTLIVALCLVFVFSLLADIPQSSEGQEPAEAEAPMIAAAPIEADFPDPPAFVADPPNWLRALINALIALLIAVALWLLWRFFRSRPNTQTLLVQQAEAALDDLTFGGDLRDVVMRCYASMSQVLRQNRNVERDEDMTPREFESHLAELGLRDEHIRRLTRLFEDVRYGKKSSGERAKLEAVGCLQAIVHTCRKAS